MTSITVKNYPGAGHDCWTATYDNPEFYQWLLAKAQQKIATLFA